MTERRPVGNTADATMAAARDAPFVRHHRRYDGWFERHRAAYLSELLAVRTLLPWSGRGLEIGIGTGRFAGPLGVEFGIDPAVVRVACAVAEALPFARAAFDYALIVATICFVDDARPMLRETARVLRPGGVLVIGLIDRESPLGQDYVAHQTENIFYRGARFFAAAEVESLLTETGFGDLTWVQTLRAPLPEVREIEPVSAGTGRGAFLAVRARIA
jgi:SAM-dependent methyltransferase